jgi:CHAT domain-containing protein/Tfp pilus assembly protein PilF
MFERLIHSMCNSSARAWILLAAVAGLAPEPLHQAHALQAGVVVEEVSDGSAGARADVRPDDVLLAWERPANPPANTEKAEGTIETVFDWMWLEMEQTPRGPLRISGQRQGRPFVANVPMGNWGISVRPRFNGTPLKSYLEGKSAILAKQLNEGLALWREVAKSADEAHSALWMYLQIANTWADGRKWHEAETAYNDSQARAKDNGTSDMARAIVWESIGRMLERRGSFQQAAKAHTAAKSLREAQSPESLSVARSLNELGRSALLRGDLTEAELYHRRALELRERAAPDSRDVAVSLNSLALIATDRAELAAAERDLIRALEIDSKLAPDTLDVARSLNNLGNVANNRGELQAAESHYGRALAIQERLAPDSLDVARSLNNLGLVALNRGDLARAEVYYSRGLALRERLAPGSVDLARSLNRLGVLARVRGDAATAEAYYRRALEIRESLSPGSLDVSDSLNNLGTVAHIRGDLPAAEGYYRRAVAIKEKLAPDSLTLAVTMNNLGHVATDKGDLAAANAHHARALEIDERAAPASLAMARSLTNMGVVVRERGDLGSAEAYLTRGLVIRERLARGSAGEAESLYELGLAYLKGKKRALAAGHFERSINALETQLGRLGGNQETQSGFRAQFVGRYRDYIGLLVDSNQPGDAFHVLERSRARTLLAMMAERDLLFTADVPEDIERERKRIAWDYDRAQARLVDLSPAKEQKEVEASLTRIRELRAQQSQLVERVRQRSPRLASLQYPRPLDFKSAQAAIDPGTVLLSYSVSKETCYLFVVSPGEPVQVHRLNTGEVQLRGEIERFRNLIQRAPLGASDLTGLLERGRGLYTLLIQPAAKTIARARRVLVVPDGPLHLLPFAALVRGIDGAASREQPAWQYFVEWKPLHVVVSATVYAELQKARQVRAEPAATTLLAFGDPTYPTAARDDARTVATRDPVVRSMLTRGYRLAALPATKREVTAIAALYKGSAETYLGDAATEERAKTAGTSARYLHFASHGLLDERFPLNSGLALTIPEAPQQGQDNGILQAWEIFERLRLNADLVVLSACETGLGAEMGGEGLVGLTRAFHYAGARSVLASLWSVADETTPVLMERFYGYLKAGRSKDAALRDAQLDLIRRSRSDTRPDGSHPYHWAAFQLNGDWR